MATPAKRDLCGSNGHYLVFALLFSVAAEYVQQQLIERGSFSEDRVGQRRGAEPKHHRLMGAAHHIYSYLPKPLIAGLCFGSGGRQRVEDVFLDDISRVPRFGRRVLVGVCDVVPEGEDAFAQQREKVCEIDRTNALIVQQGHALRRAAPGWSK